MSIATRSNAFLAFVVMTFFAVPVSAQTIQLPVFSNFSWSGAVRVPDGGGIWAGGVKSHSEGSTSRGVPLVGGIPGVNRGFQNRGIGRETGNSGISFHPQVLIMSELEEDHLAKAGYGPDGRRSGANDAVAAKAAFLTRHMGRGGHDSMHDQQANRPR